MTNWINPNRIDLNLIVVDRFAAAASVQSASPVQTPQFFADADAPATPVVAAIAAIDPAEHENYEDLVIGLLIRRTIVNAADQFFAVSPSKAK
eukprot:CAMPEP_0201217800 /NCGR_PEP_ID=MMETSP0851-20130426/190246_1 /ASSEMBLY_ACC=CAM_ASM_000631 /TAXON_ID=183588 /ORGANISM="Pseudo-nitzschia fraudulenta, Strain WWA7" /LENGTH=92 /DNA_ID=CAMNT_0047507463 /DNA_START=686 /DNA_END=962 /DNA_ORIENTATION=+